MTLHVSDELVKQSGCSADDLTVGLVIGLFYQGRLTLGQAAEALKMSKPDMMKVLAERELPMPYGREDALRDIRVVDRLWPES